MLNNHNITVEELRGRKKKFETPQLLMDAANEYFKEIDDNPITIVEQKKGNVNIKNFEGIDSDDIKDIFNPLVEMPKQRPYTYNGLCLCLGVNVQYFTDFEQSLKGKNDEISIQYSLVCTHIREKIYSQKFEGASSGIFNANIIARDLGLTDKQTITVKKIGLELEQEEYGQ